MRKGKLIISIGILAVITLLLLTSSFIKIDVEQGNAQKGKISIDRIENNRAIALKGEWEFYWNQLVDPSEFNQIEEETMDYLTVPQLWKGQTYRGSSLGETGAATYRFFLTIDNSSIEDNQGIAIKMPFVYSAYKLWLNGELVSTNGEIGLNKAEEIVQRRPEVIRIFPRSGTNELVLQITNHHFYRGGISKSILLGNLEYLSSTREKQIALDIFMAGSFFISGIFFLLLYFMRKDENIILYFTCICFIFLSRTLLTNEIYLAQVLKDFNWEIGNRMEAGFSYIGISVVLLFLGDLYKNYFTVKYTKAWKIFIIIMLPLIIFLPHKAYDSVIIYVNAIQTIYAIYLFIALIKNFDRSLPDFYVLLTGKIIVFILAIHDIIITYLVIDVTYKVQIGMYIYVISLGYVLILYLYREFEKVEKLVVENDKMFQELCEMNEDLEKLVEKRTEELEDTNRRLYELSMQDGLTGIPNRLQLDDKLEYYWQYAAEKGLRLSILFFDIDFFKNYNDNYGHIKADEALQQIASFLYRRVKKDRDAFIARYGGEEFVVLYLDKDMQETYEIAEELRVLVKEMKIPHEFSLIADIITISVGAISTMADTKNKATDVLNEADQALYKAKQGGRDRTYMEGN
ncbi:diguanylate cyclase (GGDEF) domain-containing protein [Natronincola peptidivorans]|uniref:Diguanylate cyclase (GGDEF) domain-containing protein n=1 Tax=Natronincola peptidivorans TaxID=426128 RepID=A0A1I0E0T7_9FIRM|nr:diguanylate cyclase [Natronincola peptidivorans]SET37917.1 diguanylate cyclase (GGDEF) domain-containing protein [Natronincola peptidivorans]